MTKNEFIKKYGDNIISKFSDLERILIEENIPWFFEPYYRAAWMARSTAIPQIHIFFDDGFSYFCLEPVEKRIEDYLDFINNHHCLLLNKADELNEKNFNLSIISIFNAKEKVIKLQHYTIFDILKDDKWEYYNFGGCLDRTEYFINMLYEELLSEHKFLSLIEEGPYYFDDTFSCICKIKETIIVNQIPLEIARKRSNQ